MRTSQAPQRHLALQSPVCAEWQRRQTRGVSYEDAGVCVPTGISALRGNSAFARVAGLAAATKRVALLRNMVDLATNDEEGMKQITDR